MHELKKLKIVDKFKDLSNSANIYVLKCYYLLWSNDGFKKNI